MHQPRFKPQPTPLKVETEGNTTTAIDIHSNTALETKRTKKKHPSSATKHDSNKKHRKISMEMFVWHHVLHRTDLKRKTSATKWVCMIGEWSDIRLCFSLPCAFT
uniref:Uncharacterized protein n=1 Tax=Proboscia inermis TaxID=420281 RepID=A0A7S0C538_9STRA|mmetsp:Transcript_27750/g.28145  ORF Transcript_27750/g.28145 Transcript_27750/m.28145 type:complete len:105 (+) Transcript_27750:268-582(+)